MVLLNGAYQKQCIMLLKKLCFKYRCTKSKIDAPTRDYTTPAGIPGSGAGKGGGGGGSVRESGGGLGKYGAAQEEGYFHQKQREQLEKLKEKLRRGEDIGFNQKPKLDES